MTKMGNHVRRARLDADGTVKPLTQIVHHPPVGSCVGPGVPLHRPELDVVATGERTSLTTPPAPADAWSKNVPEDVLIQAAEALEMHGCPIYGANVRTATRELHDLRAVFARSDALMKAFADLTDDVYAVDFEAQTGLSHERCVEIEKMASDVRKLLQR